jgi:hypothetical protein
LQISSNELTHGPTNLRISHAGPMVRAVLINQYRTGD